jgi:ribonuclease R
MLEFFFSLQKGVAQKDVLRNQRPIVDRLEELKAIKYEEGQYSFRSDYVIGKIDISNNGTGYLSVVDSGKKDLIVEKDMLQHAAKGDMVVAKRDFRSKGRPKAEVIYVIQKEFATSVVYLKTFKKQITAHNIKTDAIVALKASQKSLRQLPENTLLKVDNYTNEIIEVLGVLDDPKVDEKLALALYNKHDEFTRECEDQAISYGKVVDKSMYPSRVDLTDLPFCTIDPIDAKDFDDAIYFDVQENILYVAIADVSEYVHEFSPIDKEAKSRGFSIYFPHKSIPMLPRNLSENICSLMPNTDRLAFVIKMHIKDNLDVGEYEIFEAVINSKRRYDYESVDHFLAHDENHLDLTDIKILKWLLKLEALTKRIRENRLQKGFDFRGDDLSMVLENDEVVKTEIEHSTPSHALIEECMLLANVTASKQYQKGVFRNHLEPSETRIEALLSNIATLGIFVNEHLKIHQMIEKIQEQADAIDHRLEIDKMIIKTQQKAFYGVANQGHFGLGFGSYTHFTSPIRRYSDLLVHRLIKSIIGKDRKKEEYILNSIESAVTQINTNEIEANRVMWDFMDRKLARWAHRMIGNEYDAMVIDTTGGMMIAKFDSDEIKNIRIFLHHEPCEVFEMVRVRVTDSDIKSAKIMGRIVK